MSHTPIDCVPVPPLVRIPSEEKLTVTGLPMTDETCIGNALSLMTNTPADGATADMCTTPAVVCTVTTTALFRFISANRASTEIALFSG